MARTEKTDICLFLEGTYPYVPGGVSNWTHELISNLRDFTFSLVCILPRDMEAIQRYELPPNVIRLQQLRLQDIPRGRTSLTDMDSFFRQLEPLLLRLQSRDGGAEELAELVHLFRAHRGLGTQVLLNSTYAWEMIESMYSHTQPESSFIDYFWSWRALFGGLFSVLLSDFPNARVYHALSTGYAGLFAARARQETGNPAMLTEHGIYTNERRIEINAADWLLDDAPLNLSVEQMQRNLREMWNDTFLNYSRACYQSCDKVLTLFEGNQKIQIAGGAPEEQCQVVPNGIDVEKFSAVKRAQGHPPTAALIGRVVPIKDVKTFLRSCMSLRDRISGFRAFVMGPTDEDPAYYEECLALVKHGGLEETVIFTGKVNIMEYLPEIDVIALTSISEAQPLVLLEAGAAGIPTVASNVGACKEILYGQSTEEPALGKGGFITNLVNPQETAQAIEQLLTDAKLYAQMSETIRERVATYYRKEEQMRSYRNLYRHYAHDAQM